MMAFDTETGVAEVRPPSKARGDRGANGSLYAHIVHRDKVIAACGGLPVMTAAQTARYENESDPITADGDDVESFETLLDLLDQSQDRLADSVADADLEAVHTVGEREVPLWKRVHFWYFHDTYHAGQTELLRGLAGFTEKVI